jgi:hypothetical protein
MMPGGYRNDTSYRVIVAAVLLILTGCSDSASRYHPLDTRSWWDYETQTTILEKSQRQRLLITNLGSGVYGGDNIVIQRQSSGQEIYLSLTPSAIEQVGIRSRTKVTPSSCRNIILPTDIEVGASWLAKSRLALIESRTFARQDKLRNFDLPIELTFTITAIDDVIDIPAGRFDRCIQIQANGTRRSWKRQS